MAVLEELGEVISGVAAQASAGVVRVGANLRGCGVVVSDGVVVTSAHNLRGGETTITLADGRRVTATVAGADLDGDLAVLHADTTGATPLQWADEAEASVGDPVVALGGGPSSEPTVTFGFVSGTGHSFRGPRGRRVTGAIEHTAPLPRGSSGGPVVTTGGRLLGINTHRLGEGFYLAVPADQELRQRVDALATGQSPRRHRLGVGLAPGPVARELRRQVGLPERDGLLVRGVVEDGPAGRAGIAPGDLLVAAAGTALTDVDDLFAALDSVDDDERLVLGVVRGADELEVAVSFADGDRAEGSV